MGSAERATFGALAFYNCCFLLSTSTGCFFVYLFFMIVLCIVRSQHFKRAMQFMGMFGVFCTAIFFIFPSGFQVLFKFFYIGATHYSFNERWVKLVRDWSIFLDHPWLGVGFGAIPSYANGEGQCLDPEVLNRFVSTNMTMEVLASLGLFGACGFLLLLGRIAFDFRRTLRIPLLTKEENIHLLSLGISLIVLLLTIQFNPTIMRAYLWVHVAMCISYASSLRLKYTVRDSRIGF